MTRFRLPLLLAALALAGVPGAVAATPDAPGAAVGGTFPVALAQVVDDGVLDDAHLFSPEAVAAAREKVRQIRREYHVAVCIDTVNTVPASGWGQANSWSGQKRSDYVHNWAKERSRELGVEGVHVLICKQPRNVAVVVWPERLEEKFGPKDCKSIERLLTRRLITSPDETLLTALDQVRAGLQTNREPAPPSVPFGPLGVFIAGAVGVWLVLGIARLRLRKPDPFSLTGEHRSLRLTAGLLAGMFGNPSSFWITDRLFPHETTGGTHDFLPDDAPAPETPALSEESLHRDPSDEMEPMPEHAEVKHD